MERGSHLNRYQYYCVNCQRVGLKTYLEDTSYALAHQHTVLTGHVTKVRELDHGN